MKQHKTVKLVDCDENEPGVIEFMCMECSYHVKWTPALTGGTLTVLDGGDDGARHDGVSGYVEQDMSDSLQIFREFFDGLVETDDPNS